MFLVFAVQDEFQLIPITPTTHQSANVLHGFPAG
jgi:hypothetical protein